MAKRAILVVGVLSTVLAGSAQASNTPKGDHHEPYLEFIGKRFCFSNAPPTMSCDLRVPSLVPILGSVFPTAARAPDPEPKNKAHEMKIFGFHLCFDDTVPKARCDLALPVDKAHEHASS
jgi:hypothetical protein